MASKKMLRSQYEQINETLRVLRTTEKDSVLEKINEAKSHGDLSENAEYDAAREEQAKLEEKIHELEASIEDVEIIEDADLSGASVHIGSKLDIFDAGLGKKKTIEIVPPVNSKPLEGLISEESPIAKALLDHCEGETVSVSTPKGPKQIEILKIYN